MARTAAADTEVADGFRVLRTTGGQGQRPWCVIGTVWGVLDGIEDAADASLLTYPRTQPLLALAGHHDTFRLYQQLTRAVMSLYAPLTANVSGARPAPTLAAFNASLQAVNAGQLVLRDVWALMLSSLPSEPGGERCKPANPVMLWHYPVALTPPSRLAPLQRWAPLLLAPLWPPTPHPARSGRPTCARPPRQNRVVKTARQPLPLCCGTCAVSAAAARWAHWPAVRSSTDCLAAPGGGSGWRRVNSHPRK